MWLREDGLWLGVDRWLLHGVSHVHGLHVGAVDGDDRRTSAAVATARNHRNPEDQNSDDNDRDEPTREREGAADVDGRGAARVVPPGAGVVAVARGSSAVAGPATRPSPAASGVGDAGAAGVVVRARGAARSIALRSGPLPVAGGVGKVRSAGRSGVAHRFVRGPTATARSGAGTAAVVGADAGADAEGDQHAGEDKLAKHRESKQNGVPVAKEGRGSESGRAAKAD